MTGPACPPAGQGTVCVAVDLGDVDGDGRLDDVALATVPPHGFDLLPITVRVRYATSALEEATADGVPYMARLMGVTDLTHARFRWGDAFTLTEQPGPPGPEEQGSLFDFLQVCDVPDGADVPDGDLLWTHVNVWGTEPVVADLVIMYPSYNPFVVNVIVRPGAGPAGTAAIRQVYPGPLCVVERDTPTEAELRALTDEVYDPAAREALPLVSAYGYWQRGVVVVQVWAVEPDGTAYAQDRWGDRVELRGYLQPVDA